MMFAINQRDSFENIEKQCVPEIHHHAPKMPYVLVGTKRDLRKDAAFDVIEHKEGHDLASQIEAEGYFEISALTQQGVERMFDEAIRAGLKYIKKTRTSNGKKQCVVL